MAYVILETKAPTKNSAEMHIGVAEHIHRSLPSAWPFSGAPENSFLILTRIPHVIR